LLGQFSLSISARCFFWALARVGFSASLLLAIKLSSFWPTSAWKGLLAPYALEATRLELCGRMGSGRLSATRAASCFRRYFELRTVCADCEEERPLDPEFLELAPIRPPSLFGMDALEEEPQLLTDILEWM